MKKKKYIMPIMRVSSFDAGIMAFSENPNDNENRYNGMLGSRRNSDICWEEEEE